MSSREKFEQAIKARFGDSIDYRVCKNSDGEYMAWDMQVAWWAWQAAETDMAVQLANAESKCRELAAENGQMLRLLTDISENHDEYVNADEYLYAGVPMDYVSEINTYVSRDVDAENPFKATDAFLAEVRAQGVDAAIDHLSKKFEGTGHVGVPVMALEWLAQELRKGAAL